VTKIGYTAFYCNGQLSDVVVTSVDLSKVEVLGEFAFYRTNLTSVSAVDAPVLTTVGTGALSTSTLLMELDLPQVTSFGAHAKWVGTEMGWGTGKAGSLKSVNLPKVTSLGNNAFKDQSSLTSVLTPAVTSVGRRAFEGCGCLESIAMPLLTSVGDYAFYNSGINGYQDLGVSVSQAIDGYSTTSDGYQYRPLGCFDGTGVCAA